MQPSPDSSLDRIHVTTVQEPHLRLYRRLWLSRMDLDEAKGAIVEILERNLPYPRRNGPSALLQALTTAAVVTYARPFVNSRGQSAVAERTVPGSLLRVFSSREREFHDALIDMRNREIAHADADILDISLELLPDGDGGICRVSRHPLRRTELRALRHMITKLEEEIERQCAHLRTLLPLNVWL